MGKKGSWFGALKRAFTSSSKDNVINGQEKKHIKEKKRWGLGRPKHGEINSFMPLHREPSSIEKILGDAEREQHHREHQEPQRKVQQQFRSAHQEPPNKAQQHEFRPPHQGTSKMAQQLRAPKAKPSAKPNKQAVTANYVQISAVKIQTAYRGYMARKSYRALKGLVRLQRVMRGQSVKRQTTNTMRCMQLLVRVQAQVRARRLQMIERRNQQQQQTPRRNDREIDSTFSKWSLAPRSETEGDEDWDDSVLTKEEKDERLRRKVEAVMKRERALAYAYSHQLLKVTPKSAHAVLADVRSGGYPWWWNWLDRHLAHEPRAKTPAPPTPKLTATTPIAPSTSHLRPTSRSQPKRLAHDTLDTPTPRSSKLLPSPRTKYHDNSSNKWHNQPNRLRDDIESLTSCPAFAAVPNYMVPTASAKAKVRDHSIDRDGHDGGSKRRFSFNLTQSIGSLKWNKGAEEAVSQRKSVGKHKATNSIGGLSVDSTVSLPAGVGRKPFK